MIKPQTLLKYLLLSALIFQLIIDLGGFLGISYSLYPPDTYFAAGAYSMLDIRQTMALYFIWMFTHYCSIFAIFKKSNLAVPLITFGFILSFISSISSGVSVANPIDLALGWIASTSYLVAVGLFLFKANDDNKNVQ